MQARYYDPVIGRFYSNDPVGFRDVHSFNRYAYSNNNPYKYVDPDGRTPAHAIWLGARVCASNAACSRAAVAGGRAVAKGGSRAYNAIIGVFNGASDAEPVAAPDGGLDGWIYGPEDDPKINEDGSTEPNTWTTPDDYGSQEEAQDKLDPFKPMTGKRPVHIPGGTPIQTGNTPGGEGPYNGSGGANEVLVPGGLPAGSTGAWKPLNQNRKVTCTGSRIKRSSC